MYLYIHKQNVDHLLTTIKCKRSLSFQHQTLTTYNLRALKAKKNLLQPKAIPQKGYILRSNSKLEVQVSWSLCTGYSI